MTDERILHKIETLEENIANLQNEYRMLSNEITNINKENKSLKDNSKAKDKELTQLRAANRNLDNIDEKYKKNVNEKNDN